MNRKEFLRTVAAGAAGTLAGSAALPAAQSTGAVGSAKLSGDELKGSTRAVVDFITGARLESFPPEAIAQAKRCLIDGFGVILAGSTVEGSAIVRRYVRTMSSKGGASIFGPERMSAAAPHAALANGASGHAMDFDDTQLSTTPDRTYGLLTHPTVPALASSLAVAEERRASGSAFLEAFLTGFEVECKIAEAIDPEHYRRGFHSTATAGTFAGGRRGFPITGPRSRARCACHRHRRQLRCGAAGEFRLDDQAASRRTRRRERHRCGDAGGRRLHRRRRRSRRQVGYFQVLGGGAEPHRLIGALGRPHAIVNPGVSVKPYPCGSLSHPSMDAMLKLMVDHNVRPDQIKAIRLRAGSNILEPLRYKTAKTELEAKFCVPFLLGVIALRRKAGIQEFTDEFVSSAPIQQMMTKVSTVFDPKIEALGFDKIRSVVEVDLTDGRALVQPSDERYRGSPAWPFSIAELRDRFADCAAPVLSKARIQQALDQIESIEKLRDVSELTRTLADI